MKLLLAAIWAAFAAVLALTVFVIVYRAAERFFGRRHSARRALYQPLLDRLLAGEAVSDSELRLIAPGDALLLETMMLDVLRSVRGPLEESVTRAADATGIVGLRLRQLGDKDPHVRAEAMDRLGRLRARRAAPALMASLAVESESVRLVALRALGRIRAPEALEVLLDELERADEGVHQLVASALLGYGGDCVPAALSRVKRSAPRSERVVTLLGRLRAQAAVPDLLAILSSRASPVLRVAAAGALGATANPDAAPALVAALAEADDELRAQAAWALGRIGHPAFVDALSPLLGDPYPWARIRAAEALARLGKRGIAALRRRAKSGGSEAGRVAREVLDIAGERP